MKRILELIRKYKSEGSDEMLERHKKIIDKYATPYPVPGPNNWLLRYEKVMARKEIRQKAVKQKSLDTAREEEKKKGDSITPISDGDKTKIDAPALNTGTNMNHDGRGSPQIDKMGDSAYYKFVDYY